MLENEIPIPIILPSFNGVLQNFDFESPVFSFSDRFSPVIGRYLAICSKNCSLGQEKVFVLSRCPSYSFRLIEVFYKDLIYILPGHFSVRLRELFVLWDVRLKRFHCILLQGILILKN